MENIRITPAKGTNKELVGIERLLEKRFIGRDRLVVEDVMRCLEWHLTSPLTDRVLLAFSGKNVVGLSALESYSSGLATITHVIVSPAHEKTGLREQLLQEAVKHAKELFKAKRIMAGNNLDELAQQTARELGMGFQLTGNNAAKKLI